MRLISALALLILVGCSGSNENTGSQNLDTSNSTGLVSAANNTQPPAEDDTVADGTAQVTFDITVPAYVSNALQVQVKWGNKSLSAAWVADESWSVSSNLPTNTEHPLSVLFMDDNGGLVLASYEKPFKTSTEPTQTHRVTANQFETTQWDVDGDGVSNIAESIAGTNPEGIEITEPPRATLELMPSKSFRLTWQSVAGAQFYRVLENSDGVSGFTAVSDDLDSSTRQYDRQVALLKKLNASYIVQACNESTCIDSVAQQVPAMIRDAAVYLKASNTDPNDGFGVSLSLSSDGNTLAVGAKGESSTATGINGDETDNSHFGNNSITVEPGSGAAYVFQRTNGQWQQQAYIKSGTTGASDNFGGSIDLSADGNTLVVGAEYDNMQKIDAYPYSNSRYGIIGAAYVYRRSNGNWVLESQLKPGFFKEHDFFGKDVAVSGDGEFVSVVGRYDFHYVYKRDNGNWRLQADLTGQEGDECRGGTSTDISADGSTMVVGHGGRAVVKVYVRQDDNWQRQTCLKPKNQGVAKEFGRRIELSADGHTLAVGAFRDSGIGAGINGSEEWDDRSSDGEGALFVFTHSNGNWQQDAYIKSEFPETSRGLGFTIALSADAKTLVSTSSEGAHTFIRENNSWRLLSVVHRDRSGGISGSISLSSDGNTLATGAAGDSSAATGVNGFREDTSAAGSGAVFLY